MFSGLFKKKHHHATPEDAGPPIPESSNDDFVLVNSDNDSSDPADPPNGSARPLYPPVDLPPGVTSLPKKEVSFLHGVPFKLSKEFSANSDVIIVQVNEIMAFSMQRLHTNRFEYDFSVERSVLAES